KPSVTFIIVNMCHHMRAFPLDQRDGDRKSNVMPGTVIDTGVVDPHRFEFFLFGYASTEGTNIPCRYTILYDENKMREENIQRLTYGLGYVVATCTHSVPVVAPVYYAHLAADRARLYLNENCNDTSTTESSTVEFTMPHDNLMNSMFFI
ncbi:Argonaute5, partial [Phytophthora megakarya]